MFSFFQDQSAVGGSNAHPVLELNQQRPVFRNYRLLMNGTLFISKASENDEGKFICEADNGVNEPIGKMVTLKINGKKSVAFYQAKAKASLENEDQASHKLFISGGPWSSFNISSSLSFFFFLLKLEKFFHSCWWTFWHFFSAPPKFDVAHAGPVTGRTGETLELVCEAAGDDHIKWVSDFRITFFRGESPIIWGPVTFFLFF